MQLSKEQAIRLAKSGRWKKWDSEKLFLFQISQEKICTDFSAYHKATGEVLGRPVYTHEFAYPDTLMEEYLGERDRATLKDVFEKIPKGKDTMIVVTK